MEEYVATVLSIDEMQILASSVDDATPAAVGGRRPAEAPQTLLWRTPRLLLGS